MIIANENTKYQLKQITTEIIYILNTELKQRTHYENDRISISHIPIINIFRGQRIGINSKHCSDWLPAMTLHTGVIYYEISDSYWL